VNLAGPLSIDDKKCDSGSNNYRNDVGVLFYITVPKAFFMNKVNALWRSHAFAFALAFFF
jgi:hypothetical protein